MTSSIKKLALSLSLTLASAFVFMPLGCGGSEGGHGPAFPKQGHAEPPDRVKRQLENCTVAHRDRLGSAKHMVTFDVILASDGQVDTVSLRESTLRDEELEACMATALRSLSEGDLSLRRSENRSRSPAAPDSRTLLGQEDVVARCLASPACVLTVGLLIGPASVAVAIYVHASGHAAGDCDDKYQDCISNGPASCLKEEGGKTLCQRCWERCNAGDSPSARCRKCKF
jgi:hypothetical protein